MPRFEIRVLQVSLCENGQRQNCKAAIGLSIRVEMIGGGRPLLRENLAEARPPPCKTPRALQRLLGSSIEAKFRAF